MIKKATTLGFLTLVLALSLQAGTAVAQDMRIGFVEPRAVLERMPEMRAVEQRLQNFINRKQDELAELEQNFQQEIETYQQRAGVISDADREHAEERLGQWQCQLQQSQGQADQEVRQGQARLMAPQREQGQDAIDELATERGIDDVLNTTTSTGDVLMLDGQEEIRAQNDITDAVMRSLGI